MKPTPPQDQAIIRKLAAQGVPKAVIAARLRLSTDTVSRVLKKGPPK